MTKKVLNTLARKSDTIIILISLKHLYMYKNLKYKNNIPKIYILRSEKSFHRIPAHKNPQVVPTSLKDFDVDLLSDVLAHY